MSKGSKGELEIAKIILDNTSILVKRNLEQSRSGGFDLVGDEYFPAALEVKRQETLKLPAWKRQCLKQAKDTGLVPVLAYRQNRKPWTFLINFSGFHWEEFDQRQFCAWLLDAYNKRRPDPIKASPLAAPPKVRRITNPPIVIALYGNRGSGKSRIGLVIASQLLEKCKLLQFGQYLKAAVRGMLDLSWQDVDGGGIDREAILPAHGFSIRQALDGMGTGLAEGILNSTIWADHVHRQISETKCPVIIVTDMRRPSHIRLMEEYGAIFVKIERDAELPESEVEQTLRDVRPSIVVDNNSPDVRNTVETCIMPIIYEEMRKRHEK